MHSPAGAHAAFDHIGDLGFDTVAAGGFVQLGFSPCFDQFRFGQRVGAFDQRRHFRQEAGFRRRCRRVAIGQFVVIVPLAGRELRILLGLDPVAFAAFKLAGLNALRSGNRPRRTPPQKGHQSGISHDQPDQHEAEQTLQFKSGEADNKGTKSKDRHAHQQRHQLDRKGRPDRQDGQDHAHDRVAKKPAQTKAMGLKPSRIRRQRCPVDRTQGDSNRGKDQTAHGAFLAAVQGKACAPGQQDCRDRPRAPAHDHEQRRGQRRAHAPQPVLHRRIGGHHKVGIVWGVAADHHGGHKAQGDQPEAQQLLAAFFDSFGHVGV